MEENLHHDDRLTAIARYLNGSMEDQERKQFEARLASEPALREELAELSDIWDLSAEASEPLNIETDVALSAVHHRIFKRASMLRWLPRAAAAVLLLIATMSVVLLLGNREVIIVAMAGETVHHVLPDGSQVWLAEGSQISYPRQWKDQYRNVALEGLAYFDVFRDTTRAFTIRGIDAVVTVLGTSFEFYSTDSLSSVSVTEGSVRFSPEGSLASAVVLSAHQSATFAGGSGDIITGPAEENAASWATRRLVFRDAPLSAVIKQVNGLYNSSIGISSPGPGSCLLSTTFSEMSLDEVLEEMSLVLGVQIDSAGNQIIIKGDPCN